MTALLSAVLAAGAAALVVPPSGERTLARVSATPAPEGRTRHRAPAVAAVVLIVLTGLVAAGPLGLGASLVGLILAATARWWWRSRTLGRRRAEAQADVARACALLAAEVRAGRDAYGAVTVIASDCPVLRGAAAVLEIDADPVPVWHAAASRPGEEGLAELARAWAVSRATGAPLGPVLDQVAQALARDADVARMVRTELASSRATGQLMAALPLVGLGLGASIGGNPIGFLTGTPAGIACAVAATALACAGTVWTEHLARTPGAGGTR